MRVIPGEVQARQLLQHRVGEAVPGEPFLLAGVEPEALQERQAVLEPGGDQEPAVRGSLRTKRLNTAGADIPRAR